MSVFPRTLTTITAALLLAGFARADMPGGHTPRPIEVEPANAVSIRLEVGADEKEATLYLPKGLLGKAKPLDGKDAHAALGPSTLVAGVGLMLTLAVSGLGFFRLRNRPEAKGLALILALSGLLIAGRCSLRAEPPPVHQEAARVRFSGGNVRVEVVDDGDAIRLVVPPSQLADWAARLKPPDKNAP